jgi:hypothetical protein
MRLFKLFALLSVVALAAVPLSAAGVSICDGVAGNLVANCGFETGDFTSWTLGGNTGFTSVAGDPYDNSGSYGAALGPVGSDGTLTQVITDHVGTLSASFYLYNDGGTPNDFTVFWNGVDVGPNLVDTGAFGFTQYSATLNSTGSDTLEFVYRQDPAYFGLDDIIFTQATSTPEPGTMGMLLGGLGLVLAGIRRRRA